jgi:hypothetical protein
VHLGLVCCTSYVKQWSGAMNFLQTLICANFLPKMDLLQNVLQM